MVSYNKKIEILESHFSKRYLYQYIFKSKSHHSEYINQIKNGIKKLTKSQKYRITKLYNSLSKLNAIVGRSLYADVYYDTIKSDYSKYLFDELNSNVNTLLKSVNEFKADYFLVGDGLYISVSNGQSEIMFNSNTQEPILSWYVYGFQSYKEFADYVMPTIIDRMDNNRENFLLFYVIDTIHRKVIHIAEIGD